MTKLFALAAVAALYAGSASAYSTFTYTDEQNRDSIIDLGTVVADGAGLVEIYEFNGAEQGRLLGTEALHGGANSDVRISLGATTADNLLAVLKVNGQVMDQQVLDLDD